MTIIAAVGCCVFAVALNRIDKKWREEEIAKLYAEAEAEGYTIACLPKYLET